MDTGRVFFLPNSRQVETIRAVTLESHLANVTRLAQAWEPSKAFLQVPPHLQMLFAQTRPKLIRAAERHDEGKRHRFRIERNGNGELAYSYRGHRFDVTDSDLYVELLIRLHHNAYAVGEINDAIARLRLESGLQDLAELFPFDAYALQMCDQVIAEVEIYALDDKNPRKPEFMEFKTERVDERRIAVEPYPFSESEVTLAITYADISVPAEIAQDAKELTALVKNASPTIQSKEAILCPSM
ncbi:MAG TPA: hypothetical protein VNK49_00610 [Anaerolineales bacterium]|nr:hypothetical protein [Anaerolineales bacterium]